MVLSLVWMLGTAQATEREAPAARDSDVDALRRRERQGVWTYRIGLGAAVLGGVAAGLQGRVYRDTRVMGEMVAGAGVATMLMGSLRSQQAAGAMGEDVDPYVAYAGSGLLAGSALLWGAALRSETPVTLKDAAGSMAYGGAVFAVSQHVTTQRMLKERAAARAERDDAGDASEAR